MDILFIIIVLIVAWLVGSHALALWLNTIGVQVTTAEVAVVILAIAIIAIGVTC